MAIKYNGKNVMTRKSEEEKRREQEEKETRQKELQEKQLGLSSYMFKYAPPDVDWQPAGTAKKRQITSVKQKSNGLIYPAAQAALIAKQKRDQVEEQLKNAGKVTISGGNAFVPGVKGKPVKMPEVSSKDGNKAVNLREVSSKDGNKAVNLREVGASDLGLRTSEEVLNSFLSFLEKENKSAQDVIDNPEIAENDPEKIKAQKDQTRLKEYQKNAQTQLDALPKETAERQPMVTPNYTPEENAFVQKIQAGQNKQAQQGYQPIPKVLNKEAQYMWHITHVPQDTEGEDYVKWLQDGMDLGLYDRKDVNAEIAQTGKTTPYDEYKALAEEYKSGAWNYRYNKQQQNIVGLEKAWEYADSYQYGSDRGRLEEELNYYTGQLDEANKLIAGHDNQQENQIHVNLSNLNEVELQLPGVPAEHLKKRNERYKTDWEYRMAADEAFYDAIMGIGAYNDVLDYNDAHQKNRELDEEFDKKLDAAWTAFEEGRKDDIYNILTGSKTSLGDYVSQQNYAENKIQETQAKLKKYDQIDAALSQYDGISGADYDPALDRGRETLWTYDDEYYDPNVPYESPFTTDVHRIYSFINKGKEYQAYLDFVAGGNVDNAKVSEAYGKSALMNKEMKRKFNDLYRQGKYDEAAAFLNGISVYLNEMYSDYEHIYTEELARQMPITSSIYATGSEMVSGVAGIARTFAGLAGDKSVEDPNSAWYASTRKSEQIQQGIADMIGGTGGKVYLAGMNTLRNMMNAATISALGITGPWSSAAGLTLFAAQIYQDQTYKYLEETHDYNKAVSYALLDALLETLEEKLPYDTMLKGGPNLLKNILANVGSEMGEEFTGATLFDTIKGMIKGEDEIENRKDQIFNEGGFVDGSGNWTALDKTNENEAMAKAQIQAMREKGQEIIENTIGGGLGGGLGGFYGVWQNYNENKYWGKKVRGRQNIIGNETGADQLINAALGMKDDTASKKLALKISENANNGKEASDAQIGKLARTMATETNTKIADIAWGAVKWKIHRELTEAGASPEYAGEAAPILADAVMGDGKMNKSDVAAVAKDKRGIEVLKSWLVRGSEKTEEALEEKAGKDTMKANRTVKSLLQGENKYVYSGFVAREINDAHKSANMASEDVIATAKGRRAGRGTDAVWTTADQGDQIVQVIGKEGNKYRIKTEDGNTQLVDAGSLQAASDVLGTVMELGNRNNIKLEDEAVNAILRGYEANKGLSGEKYVNDAINAYLRFRTGGTMEKSSLTDKTLEQIRETAEAVNKREHESNLAEGKNQLLTAPGKGTIVYQNESGEHEFGSFAWKNALKSLDANRRTQANALAQLTTMIGTHVVLKYEPGTAAFGWEDSGTGRIVINLAATDSSGSSRHILTIAAHEMTHWLQQNSDEGYRELRQFVFDQLRKQGGEDAVEKLIMMTMDDYRAAARNSNNKNFELPSIERAMAEVVANACDQVLSNTKLIETLQNENPNLYEKVRGFVADFVKRIQDAIGNEELYNDSRESRLLKKAGQEVFDQLQEKWMIARNEAVNREREPGESMKAEKVQNSIPQVNVSEETSQERITRIQARNNGIKEKINEQLNDDDLYSTPYIRTILGEKNYHAFDQWLHNKYGEKDINAVSKTDIIDFLREDNERIKNGAKQVSTEWRKISKERMEIEDITKERTTKGKKSARADAIREDLFEGKNSITIKNKDTNASIRADKTTIAETFAKNSEVTEDVSEKVLRSIKSLLENAKYIGSHINYAHENGNVHYLVTPIEEGNRDYVVMFGVHDPIDYNQKQIFSERAYIAEIIIANQNGAFTTSWAPSEGSQQGLRRYALRTVSIGEILNIVNDDRIRFFDKSAMEDKRVNFSVPQRDVDVSAWKRYQMRDGELYMMDNNDNETKLTGLDREYVEAWRNHDWARMEEILADKIRENGAIPFKTPNAYTSPSHQWVANAIKTGNTMAIGQAAQEMAQLVPDNAVLVPMPNHHGQTTDDTDTVVLAEAISKITGRPVIRALAGVERESRKADKAKPKSQQMKAADLGFRQVAEIPAGTVPYFIDNVIASGLTAEAAHRAMGNNGVTLAYAKSTRSANDGLKRANVTFYDTSKQYGSYLIPLSERIDMSRKGYAGTKFSVQQLDDAYMEAIESGDIGTAEALNKEAARRAGFDTSEIAYHGSSHFGFTEFSMEDMQGQIFVAYSKRMAQSYTQDAEEKAISEAPAIQTPIMEKMGPEEFAKYVKSVIKEMIYGKIKDIKYIPEEGVKGDNIKFKVEFVPGSSFSTAFRLVDNEGKIFEKWDLIYQAESKLKGSQEGIYSFYTRPGNQLVVDADGSDWNDIPFDLYGIDGTDTEWDENYNPNVPHKWATKTRDIARWAKAHGYDSVRINNLYDDGGGLIDRTEDEYIEGIAPGDIAIFFNPNDVKSADPITYEDDGSIIPPSERYSDESNDLRFSVQQQDRSYMEAVNDGNMQKAQAMVDEAAEEALVNSKIRTKNGKLLKVYHGTSNMFTVFDTSVSGGANGTAEGYGIYLSDNQEITEKYGNRQIAAYLDMERPARDDKKTIRKPELVRLIRATCEAQAKQIAAEEEYDDYKEVILDTWISNYVNTRDYPGISAAYAAAADVVLRYNNNDADIVREVMAGMAIRDYERAMDFYHTILTPTTGIDGFWMHWTSASDNSKSNVFLALDSSQIKSADPVTYDDDGNVIPLSERLDKENSDIRYSIDQGDMNVQVWLQGLTEGSLSTAQEKTMLRQYQDLKKGLDVMRGLNEERRRKLEKLLAKPNPSAYDRKQIRDLQAVIQAKQREIDRQEEKLAKVTGDKGFARLMYTQAKIMEDLVNGRTADDVRHTVDAISRELETVKKEMAERSEQLKTLAAKEAVIRIRQQLNSAGLKRIAAKLKTDLNSNLSNTEIENRLALMALKMKEGKVDSDEVTELADMLIGKMNPAYDSYVLETLRGRTITLNKNQLAELKGQNRTVREIQQELAGTGIRIRTAGGNTLDQNWDELCDLLPQLNREASDADMLDNLLDLVASEQRAARAEGANNDQVAAMVVTAAADLIPEIVTDKKSMQLIRETLKYIAEMSRQAGETAKAMEELNSLMDRLQTKGRQAKSTLGTLENKIHDAIEYNNKLTEQSEAATWKEERRKLINSLNSEHAQAMIAQQQEFRERIEKDRKARNTQAENAALRRRINTNITRVRALLMRESAQKNIPEHMKPIARHMLEKIVNNDLVGRKISGISREDLQETKRVLDAWKAQDGEYNPDSLKGLDDAVQDALYNAVEDLISGIEYYNESAKGHSLQENLDRYNGALTEISNAVSTITGIINAERTISLGDRRVLLDDMAYKVQESTGGRRAKEFTGRAGLAIANLRKAVVSGNLTPEYFFRTLKNAGLDDLWEEYHRAENRNGLELMKAQTKLDEIAKKYGYKNWDMDKRLTVKLDSGDVNMTLGQIMSLYATWKREHTLGPAMSNHLQMGGFYTEESDPRQGFLGRRVVDLRAHRVNEQDMQLVQSLMTDEQQQFVDEIVSYMSNEMSELGNEASMKAYGIKMYKESYYFPFKMWDGIKARASNDSGSAAAANERAFHPSFSKTRQHNANNAVMIGDFVVTAADHIVGMINYATMGLANENLQRVLNKQVPEGDRLDTMTKRTIRTVLQEAYGKEATDYLAKLQEQLNGGVSRIDRTLYDRALTLFRKNAVAGSMSVALQQPLSYIRAAMMINPKYLAGALSPVYWRGSFKEMMAHSGVAVIKKMGRFDMGFGAGAREFITPEGKEGRVRQAWDAVTEKATILPELMDQMTWTRMWSAVKMEQHALHPEMDVHSDAFLDMVGERFNDIMRKTQVYDSTLTKSQNMRSQNPFVKSITSFMAEPTLTLNVLADAARNAGEKGGKVRLAKALATFALSAAAQAAVKAIMSSGRSPDDKKTWYENFAYRFWTNLIQEADVANLVPGYNDLIMLLKNGKLDDDAMGAIGKIFTAFEKMTQVASPDKINDYRAWEDGPAQIIQLFSQLPAKNIMRDLRAMYNWFIGKPYAQREDSAAVLKLQRDAVAMNADNLLGVIVAKLGEAGYKTTNNAYYGRMFQAMQRGDQAEADQIREYLELAKGVDDKKIESGLRSQARDNLAPAESSQWMIDNDLMDGTGTITTQYKEGDITADEAMRLYREADPKLTDNDIWWKIDRIDYYKETGETETGYYYRMEDAIKEKNLDKFKSEVKDIVDHGVKEKTVINNAEKFIKEQYKEKELSRAEAESMLVKFGGIDKNEAWWALDRIDYQEKTSSDETPSGYYYRMNKALDDKNLMSFKTEVKNIIAHGVKKETVINAAKGRIKDKYRDKEITRKEAENMLVNYGEMDKEEAWWTLDRIDYQKDTRAEDAPSGYYYRLGPALETNRSEQINAVIKDLLQHGKTKEQVKQQINTELKQKYLESDSAGRVRIRDEMQKAYKAAGYTVDDANKQIEKWKKDAEKKK